MVRLQVKGLRPGFLQGRTEDFGGGVRLRYRLSLVQDWGNRALGFATAGAEDATEQGSYPPHDAELFRWPMRALGIV